jgi:hypothetical protein
MWIRPILLALCSVLLVTAPAGQARQGAPQPAPTVGFSTIPSPAAEGSAEPNLATDARGGVWLSWLEPRPGGGHRFRLASLSGSRWSEPVTVSEGSNLLANWADFPSVFAARNGTLVAHWLERGEPRGSYGIRVSTSTNGGRTWTTPVVPHDDSFTGEYGFVSFFDTPAGDVGMVWLDGRTAGGHAPAGQSASMALRSTLFRNGTPSAQIVVDARVCDCCQTSAARTSDGVLVAYRDRSDKEIRDTSVIRFTGGKWSEPITVHGDGWEINGCPVNGPVVTASGNAAAVAWFTGANNSPKTLVAFSSDAGKTFSSPIRIDASVTLGRLAMVMPSADRVLVSSLERSSGGAHLVLRDVRRDGQTKAPVEIAPATPDRSGGFARLARSGSRLVVAWTDVRPGAPAAVRTAVAEMR